MIRERGNTSSTRKVIVDPRVSYEIGKIKQLIPRVTYGSTFPAQYKVGDLHFYQGATEDGFVANNWYAGKPGNDGWQSINATSVTGENISGNIPAGVTIKDYLSKFGGIMEGLVTFAKDQKLPGEMVTGKLPAGVTIEDYVSIYGATMLGSLVLGGYHLTRVGTITGLDTQIKITMNQDGKLTLEADNELTLSAATLTLIGLLGITGDVAISGDLQVNGTNIGISTDTDLITLALNLVTVAGEIKATTAKLGDVAGGNYAEIESDGTLKLNGNATVWDDIRITPGSFDRPGVADPAYVAYYPAGGGLGVYLPEFAKNDFASFTIQLPHGYKQGTDISVHLHWTPGDRGNEENGATVGWKVDYSWANADGTFGAMATADLSDACDGTDHKHQMTPEVVLDGHTAGKSISSMLICNVRRSDTGTDDTWASAVSGQLPLLLEVDFHFELDTIGSRTISAK